MSQVFDAEQQTYSPGFHVAENYAFKSERGLSRKIVEQISEMKGEPDWMRTFRLKSLALFEKRPMPTWGADLSGIDFDNIYYYIKPVAQQGKTWDDIPSDIKDTFDRLGIPQAEQKYLAGVTAQYESEAVYHKVREDLEKLGVIFTDMDTALRLYPDLIKEHFGSVIPPSDNKFASLNSAVWSGGSFVYVPEGVRVEIPLQAYFRINAQNMGQFERTLIIAAPGSYVHYVEGCFLAGARVRTRAGEKLIEDIQEGDEVFTHKGRYRRVYHTMQRPYQGTIYHIQCFDDGGRTLHVTEEHPLLVVRRKDVHNQTARPEWLTASEVKPGDFLVVPLPQVEEQTRENLQVSVAMGRGRRETAGKGGTFPHDAEEHMDGKQYLYAPIPWIEIEQMDTTVYNFSVEEDESYVAEGVVSHNCTAPNYSSDSLHSAVVEIKVMEGARVRYTTIQNWSKNVYNLVTKRAAAYRDATMEWVDGNLGSKVTMKYPAVLLMEPGARGDILSVAFAGDGMHLDAGAKVTHLAPYTTSQILSKSVSKGTGRATYRGLVRINRGAHHTKSNVRCDALLLDEYARTDTYPTIRVEENQTEVGHEATVSKVGDDQLFYLMSRGLDESEAYSLIVNGFIEPITKELPMEYAVELNRLIQLEMSGSVG